MLESIGREGILRGMERIDQRTIAQALLTAPGWARIGITHPKPSLRQDAADELARQILEHIGSDAAAELCSGQSVLPL